MRNAYAQHYVHTRAVLIMPAAMNRLSAANAVQGHVLSEIVNRNFNTQPRGTTPEWRTFEAHIVVLP